MLTLVEASKLKQNPLQAGVIETFASNSPVLERIPFMDVAGNAYTFNREQTLPGVAFRDFNESYTESTGVVQQSTEVLKIFGGTARVDRAQVKTQGNLNDLRAIQTNMKAKAAALDWTKNFFKGDVATDPKGFDGLEKRLTGSQVLDNDNNGALNLFAVDKLIDAVQGGPDVLFMNKTMRRTLNALRREARQATEVVSDAFGRQIDAYAGIPIGIIEDDAGGNPILGFAEGSDEDTTSIYAVRFGVQEWVGGLQAGPLEVIDQGLIDVWYQTLIEWICSFTIFHPKAAARLQGIKDSGY